MSSEFRLDQYLARISLNRRIGPDFATLSTIHTAHVDAIPFENFDPLLRRAVALDLASVQQKLVGEDIVMSKMHCYRPHLKQ